MGGGLVCQPKWETRGVQDFVLAHVPKPFFGVLIDCGVLAFSTEVKKRIVWPPNIMKKVLLVAVLTRDSH